MSGFQISIASPERILFDGEAQSVQLPGVAGTFSVLNGHAPLVSELDVGIVTVTGDSSEETRYAIDAGFAEVKGGKVTVLVEGAIKAEEIDVQQERAQLETLIAEITEGSDRIAEKETAIKSRRVKLALAGEKAVLN